MRAMFNYRCREFLGFLFTSLSLIFCRLDYFSCLIVVCIIWYFLFALPSQNTKSKQKNLVPHYMSSTVYLSVHYYAETTLIWLIIPLMLALFTDEIHFNILVC